MSNFYTALSMKLEPTYQPLSLYASGMSGLIIRVLLKDAESDRPPKSESFAPLMATTGWLDPSNFSAYEKKERHTIFNLLSPSLLQTDNIRYTCFWTKRSFMVLNKYGQRFIKRFRKSLSTKNKAENQYWMATIFRPAAPH